MGEMHWARHGEGPGSPKPSAEPHSPGSTSPCSPTRKLSEPPPFEVFIETLIAQAQLTKSSGIGD